MGPAEIVSMASGCGLRTIALTDHDTMAGTAEMMEAGEKNGIEVIPGLELSVVFQGTSLHLLGYLVDEQEECLQEGLRKIQRERNERNRKIIEKLVNLGLSVSMDELQKASGHGQAGRPHIAAMLIDHGVVKTMNQAFQHYLRKGRCAYSARTEFKLETAMELIKGAGGVAVLAHPGQMKGSLATLEALIRKLVVLGLDGVELHYPTHSSSYKKKLGKLTEKYDLIHTGGSDYHGTIRAGTSLGVELSGEPGEEIIQGIKRKQKG